MHDGRWLRSRIYLATVTIWRLKRSRSWIERTLSTPGMSKSPDVRAYLLLLHRMCTILIRTITRCRSSYIRQVVATAPSTRPRQDGSTTSVSLTLSPTKHGSSGSVAQDLAEQERMRLLRRRER